MHGSDIIKWTNIIIASVTVMTYVVLTFIIPLACSVRTRHYASQKVVEEDKITDKKLNYPGINIVEF